MREKLIARLDPKCLPSLSAALRAELSLGSQYSDWKSALALASACVAYHILIKGCRREAPDVWSFIACMHDYSS